MRQKAANLTAAALVILGTGAIAHVSRAQNAQPPRQQFGDFTISNYVKLKSRFGVSQIGVEMTGPRLSVSSPQYDMAAPRIQMTARKVGKPPRFKVTEATATGRVRLVVRQPEAQRTTIVTCDSAVYTTPADPTAAARIDLKGNVRSETRDPAFVQPLVNTAESGFIEMIGPNETNIELNNGNTTVTPVEPKPKPKKTPNP